MKKKSKGIDYINYYKKIIIIASMIFCILLAMISYWIFAYNYKYKDSNNKIISIKANDYVYEDNNIIYLKNINDDTINDFINKQKEVIDNNVVISRISYKNIYNRVLSIFISYVLDNGVNNYEETIVLNIDLNNNSVMSNDDMIEKFTFGYKDVAKDIFNKYIRLSDDYKFMVKDAITEEELTSEEFNSNSEKYIIRIREKIPDIIKFYINDNKLYYSVRLSDINKVCYYTNNDNISIISEEIIKF